MVKTSTVKKKSGPQNLIGDSESDFSENEGQEVSSHRSEDFDIEDNSEEEQLI